MKRVYNKNKKIDKSILTIIVCLTMTFNFLYLYKIGYIKEIFIKEIPQYSDVINNQVDNFYRQTLAFANGRLSFLDDATALESLNNPYDIEERSSIYYLFDTSYYKGNYYSYYTILPIIFILLPIYLVSHNFLNLIIVNLMILSLATYVASKLYKKIIEKYIPNIPFYLYILGFLALLFGSNMFLLIRGLKYDIAVSCGILFIASTLYFLSSLDNLKQTKIKLVLAGICTAFIVLSKPTYIIYYILLLYIVYNVYKTNIKKTSNILYYVLPIICIGIFQMIYNYVRYESIFEFGAKYQLTGFNLLDYIHISGSRILRAFKYYIFQIPKFDVSNFPYIFMNTNYDNYLYNEWLYENVVTGLITYPVIVLAFIIFFSKSKDKVSLKIKNCLKLLYIIFIFMVVINATCAGVSEIYSLEFKFILMFVSIIYILNYINLNPQKKIIHYIFIISCILNIGIIFPISYSGEELCFLPLLLN